MSIDPAPSNCSAPAWEVLLQAAGYATRRKGPDVLVQDPVHTLRGGMAVITEYRTVRVTSLAQAIRFIEERS